MTGVRIRAAAGTTLLALLPPPSAVIRAESELAVLPAASFNHMPMVGMAGFGGTYTVQPAVFFESLGREKLSPEQRIYYFMHAVDLKFFLSGGIAFGEFGGITHDELLVLVNEESELAEGWFLFLDSD